MSGTPSYFRTMLEPDCYSVLRLRGAIAGIAGRPESCQKETSRHLLELDHLVSNGEHTRRNGKAERLGGLEIDDQLNLGRAQDRQVGGFSPLRNLPA
jgi:hypothetical protein